VLLSFLSKKIVSTKWRIEIKRHFGWSQTPEARISRGCRECELFFSTEKFAKNFISGLYKMKKKFGKRV
jgi:hypothetical protein